MAKGTRLFTPDKRYLIVRERLWRAANPKLPAKTKKALTQELMRARRLIGAAQRAYNSSEVQAARARVQTAKVALGERGPVWWTDGSPDYSRHLVKNTPYAAWYVSRTATPARARTKAPRRGK